MPTQHLFHLLTNLYDKLDDFNFQIVNFPFLSSKIPSGSSYDVYILQLIRYARCYILLDNCKCKRVLRIERPWYDGLTIRSTDLFPLADI